MSLHFQRRQFLRGAMGATAIASLSGPALLRQAARAAEANDDGRILVVLQLSGGNDGLNTIVPFRDQEYYKQRPQLAIPEARTLRLTDDHGMHPAMTGLAAQFEAGRVAVVQGIGYDNPNRSHFESMDIWHSCRRKDQTRTTGWLGRCFDQLGSQQGDVPGIHLGEEKQPFALAAERMAAPSIGQLDNFQLRSREQVTQLVRDSAAGDSDDSLLSFVKTNAVSALETSRRVREAAERYRSTAVYPETALGEKLRTVAKLISAGMGTKVYYLTLDGFDTHSEQEGAHASLLRKWSGAVDAFLRDLESQGSLNRVLLMCFSEFGRRVQENASAGTDHGAAAPAFLIGDPVQGGIHGRQPSLTDLQQGDLKHHTDFRQLYATVLEKWLKVASEPLLEGKYAPLDVL
ncbi:MAG: DUF1501 domain-containing protein [Planctomycetales bacterium]|nr:DUF1501 domain-containing protein [Planctomycetales bacterium]